MNRKTFLKSLALGCVAIPAGLATSLGGPKTTVIQGHVVGQTFTDVGVLRFKRFAFVENCRFYGVTQIDGGEGDVMLLNSWIYGTNA